MAIDFEKVSALCVDDQSSYPELSMGGEWRVRKKAVEVMRIDVYIYIYIYIYVYVYIHYKHSIQCISRSQSRTQKRTV